MSAISGQKTVAAAGTAVALGTIQINGPLMIKALAANAGLVYVGNDGTPDVASDSGLELAAAEVIIYDWVGNLGSIYLDSAENGEGVAWLKLNI